MKNVFGISCLEHRLLACAPSRFATCCFPKSAEYNSAGRTDLEVYVPRLQTAGLTHRAQPQLYPRYYATRARGPQGRGYSMLRDAHFFPNAAFFFPIVKRFAVDLVDGSLRNRHPARLSDHEEINIVNCAVRSFHIDARKIFAAAETGKPILVDPHQIERQIFASVVDVKLSVGGIFALSRDVSFNPHRDIGIGDFLRRGALQRSGWYLGQLLKLRRLRRPWMLRSSSERHSHSKKARDRYCAGQSTHLIGFHAAFVVSTSSVYLPKRALLLHQAR